MTRVWPLPVPEVIEIGIPIAMPAAEVTVIEPAAPAVAVAADRGCRQRLRQAAAEQERRILRRRAGVSAPLSQTSPVNGRNRPPAAGLDRRARRSLRWSRRCQGSDCEPGLDQDRIGTDDRDRVHASGHFDLGEHGLV